MSRVNVVSSVLINIIIMALYINFLFKYHGLAGAMIIYTVSIGLSIAIFFLKNKNVLIELTLSFFSLTFYLYAMLYVNSYKLVAELLMVLCVVYSITFFYFDWDKIGRVLRSGSPPPTFFGLDLAKLGKKKKPD